MTDMFKLLLEISVMIAVLISIIFIIRRAFPKKMNVILLLALLICTTFFITACNHQQDILEGITAGDIDVNGNYKKIETPEHITETYDEFSNITLSIDAEIVLPETTAYPVIKATKSVYSEQDTIDFIELCVGTDYELYSEWNLTKEELEQKYTKVKQYEELGILPSEYLVNLKKSIANAPLLVDNPKLNISEMLSQNELRMYATNKTDTVAAFLIVNDIGLFSYSRDMFMEVCPSSLYEDNQFDEDFETEEQFLWKKPGEPEISQEDAYTEAQKYIEKFDIDLDLYYSEPCVLLVDSVDKSTGWRFTFTKKINNMYVQCDDGWTFTNPEAPPSYGAPWTLEVCKIIIDKNGLCSIWWKGLSEINETIIESAKLEKFENIENEIINQLNNMYKTHKKTDGTGLDIKISEIELGYSLVSNIDETESGVFIPTWYVTYTYKWQDESEEERYSGQVMFSAIDGSYIEPRLTNYRLFFEDNAISETSG